MHRSRKWPSSRQVESHPVAELVHAAIVAQLHNVCAAERDADAAQRPRRKRAPRRLQRAEPDASATVSDNGNTDETVVTPSSAPAAAAGGEEEKLKTFSASATPPRRRKRLSKLKSSVLREQAKATAHMEPKRPHCCTFLVRNLVARDEVEDPDERQELEDDTRVEFAKFGALTQLKICGENGDDGDVRADSALPLLMAGDVVVEFDDPQCAVAALAAYDGRVFGGRSVTCLWMADPAAEDATSSSVFVRVGNMLAADELEDDDEFDDVRDEMASLFARFGDVQTIEICRSSGVIAVAFEQVACARQAVEGMHGSVYGGRSVTATLEETSVAERAPASDGDAVGAAPKRERAMDVTPIENEVVDVVVEFLKRLASLQERAHQQNPLQSKRSRRLVLGLHEVRRGLVVQKIRLLVVASDIEASGVLDEKLAEILELARRDDVPVISPMNRRKLGRVLSKNARVSCVGIYSVDGANDHFARILHATRSPMASAESAVSR